MSKIDQSALDERAAKVDVEAANDSPVAQQPCSGTMVVRSSAYGSGASASSPDIVCSIKRAS